MATIFSIIFAIFIFSFLIFIHEFGHFITAKLSGVQVNEFAIFMGPAIWKKQKGETLYSIRCIPIGGYCAMEGEDGQSENPRSFQNAKWWKRLIVLVAGSAMNFVTGLLLVAIVAIPVKYDVVPEIYQFEEYATVDDYGLQVGDRFVEIDGSKILMFSDVEMLLMKNPDDHHDIVVERNGELVELDNFYMQSHEVKDEKGETVRRYGFSYGKAEDMTFGGKLKYIWNTSVDWIRVVFWSLEMLFNGQASVTELSGPVGIVQQMSQVAGDSETVGMALMNLLYFGGFIAVNLAVMNLMPIPALDGGRAVALLLTTAIEGITRKKIDPKYEGYIHAAGMILLLGLIAVIMFKDVIFLFK